MTLEARDNHYFTTSYNIVPTILDLPGIQYQTNLYPGVSVFSDEIKDNLFVSQTGGMFDKRLFSPDASNFFSTTHEKLTPEQIEDFRHRVARFYYQREQMDKIYRFDIFNAQTQH